MGHTPGPWFVREPDGDEHTEVYAEKTGVVCYPEPDDAHLISAAPELLTALKVAAEFISGHNECLSMPSGSGDRQWNDYCIGLLEDCKAAIDKAEGRSE
jgi:hypothetical protein